MYFIFTLQELMNLLNRLFNIISHGFGDQKIIIYIDRYIQQRCFNDSFLNLLPHHFAHFAFYSITKIIYIMKYLCIASSYHFICKESGITNVQFMFSFSVIQSHAEHIRTNRPGVIRYPDTWGRNCQVVHSQGRSYLIPRTFAPPF